jgi:nuclear pore complex protein Nup107
MRLRAARAFSDRVSGRLIVREKTALEFPGLDDESGPGWFEAFANADFPDGFLKECKAGKEELVTTVRNLWELECLVKALDSMETLSSLAGLSREYVGDRPPLVLCKNHMLTSDNQGE